MKGDILVIGDSCRDIFVYCEADRLCPDVPVPVLRILNETENEGMAKNVQRNIHSFVPSCDIITNNNWYYNTKTRYVHERTNHIFVRIDSGTTIDRINLRDVSLDYKIVVISDYNKGFLAIDDIEYICNKHTNVFLDTKKILGSWADRAKYIKINDYEYVSSMQYPNSKLLDKLIHTKGGDGCVFRGEVYPVKRVEVKDSSGAGDSFLAGLVCRYLKTRDIIKSIEFANGCAERVVQQRGVTII